MTDDPAAFCAAQHRRLVGLLSLQVGDRHVAEELAQDVLLKVCEHWSGLNDPVAWMHRVAINQANSWFRRRAAERRANARHQNQQAGPAAPDRADAVAVREAVARLPKRQRAVLAYRYYAGLSVRETAAAMSCAEGTVKALTHQAIAALRERSALFPITDEEPFHVQ